MFAVNISDLLLPPPYISVGPLAAPLILNPVTGCLSSSSLAGIGTSGFFGSECGSCIGPCFLGGGSVLRFGRCNIIVFELEVGLLYRGPDPLDSSLVGFSRLNNDGWTSSLSSVFVVFGDLGLLDASSLELEGRSRRDALGGVSWRETGRSISESYFRFVGLQVLPAAYSVLGERDLTGWL